MLQDAFTRFFTTIIHTAVANYMFSAKYDYCASS